MKRPLSGCLQLLARLLCLAWSSYCLVPVPSWMGTWDTLGSVDLELPECGPSALVQGGSVEVPEAKVSVFVTPA